MAESSGSRLTSDDDFWDTKPTKCQTYDNNFGGVSVWWDQDKLTTFTRNAREGDRLELVNSNLPHLHYWAIYRSSSACNYHPGYAVQFFNRASRDVCHYNLRSKIQFFKLASKDVIVTCIFDFFRDSKVRINNSKDKDWSPLGTRYISMELTYQEVFAYTNQFKDNEDFVNYCRYDRDCEHIYRLDNNYGRKSKWYSKPNMKSFISEVRVGDRLEFRGRSPHECWGIYIGQWGEDSEQVVLCVQCDRINSVTSTERLKPNLCVKSIQKHAVEGHDQVRINNEDDQRWPPLHRIDILHEISSRLPGRAGMHEYKLPFKDSKRFVNYCRYDYWRRNFGLVSYWSDYPSLLPLHEGDRLEFKSPALQCRTHWGIYLGAWGDDCDQVVHYFDPADGNREHFFELKRSGSGSAAKDKPVLFVGNIWTFPGKVRINNEADGNWPPFDRENILKEISRQLPGKAQTRTHYKCKVLFKDGEGFVNYTRYDDLRINFELSSDWCNNWQSLPQLQVGDRLEFSRTTIMLYAHWGIYVGDWGDDHHQVVHFAPANGNGKMFSKKKSSGSGSSAEDKPVLKVSHIDKVLGNNKVRVNNKRDRNWPPYDRTYILAEIKRQLKRQADGLQPEYHLFFNNCEHFVNDCRYKRHRSDQVTPFH